MRVAASAWQPLGALILGLGLTTTVPAYLTRPGERVTDEIYDQRYPDAVYSQANDQFLLVYIWDRSPASEGREIWVQRLISTGSPMGAPFFVGDGTGLTRPRVAYSETSDVYLLVWDERVDNTMNQQEVRGQLVSGALNGGDGDGQLIGTTIDISTGEDVQRDPDVVWNSGTDEFLVVWEDESESNLGIRGRRVTPTGSLGSDFQIHGDGERPRAASNNVNDDYLVVWEARGEAFTANHRARRVTGGGAPTGDVFDLSPGGPTGAGRIAVEFGRTTGRYLCAFVQGGNVNTRRVAVTAGGGDGDGETIGDAETVGPCEPTSSPALQFVEDFLDHWLVAWDNVAAADEVSAAWVDRNGVVLRGVWPAAVTDHAVGLALREVADSPGDTVNDTPRIFNPMERVFPEPPGLSVYTRAVPEGFSTQVLGETDRLDFLEFQTLGVGWQIAAVLPDPLSDVTLQLFDPPLFYTFATEMSDIGGSGQAELIAIDAEQAGAEDWFLLVDFIFGGQHTHRAQSAFSGTTPLTIGDEEIVFINVDNSFVDARPIDVVSGTAYFIAAIPRVPTDLDLAMAAFDSDAVSSSWFQSRDTALSIADTPNAGEVLGFTAPDTDEVGLAVWTSAGSGNYTLQIRPFGQPTTEEIVAHLLGLLAARGEYDVNGDGPIDAADLVESILAGR